MPCPIGRFANVPPDHCARCGNSPSDSLGNSIPVARPTPKPVNNWSNLSSPSFSANMSVPTLEDLPKIPVVVYCAGP